jgi:ferritin
VIYECCNSSTTVNSQNKSFDINQYISTSGDSLVEWFNLTLSHEQDVTASLKKIRAAAKASEDQSTEIFMEWFISEQVEEEDMVQDICTRLQLAGSNTAALLMIDGELGSR